MTLRIIYNTSNHSFHIETGRHSNTPREDRLCKWCGENKNITVVEDEYHVLFECFAYEDIRQEYIRKYYTTANHFNFISLMQSNDIICLINLAKYISSVFKIRKSWCL